MNTISSKRKRFDQVMLVVFRATGIIAAAMIVLIFVFVAQRGLSVFMPSYGDSAQSAGEFLGGMRWRQDRASLRCLYYYQYIDNNYRRCYHRVSNLSSFGLVYCEDYQFCVTL